MEKKRLEKIQVTTAPTKIDYIEGQDFDKTDMVVTATYNNGKSNEVSNYKVTNGKNLQMGSTEVTISYTEDGITKLTSQSITVEKKRLEKIQVTMAPIKIDYIEGQDFDEAGMEVTATYNNGKSNKIMNYSVTGGMNLQESTNSVTISYVENGITRSTSQNITVEKKRLEKIQVTIPPTKIDYIEGQDFESAGMKIKAIYNDGKTKIVNGDDTGLTVIDGENLTTDIKTVIIRYTENGVTQETTQTITVELKALEISIPDTYKVLKEEENNYIANIEPSTTIENIKHNITTDGNISIYRNNVEVIDKDAKIATGMKIRFFNDRESDEFIISVIGDVNGDGEATIRDILAINKHRLGKTQFKNEFELAGDVNKDNKVDIRDILKINKFRLGKINSL